MIDKNLYVQRIASASQTDLLCINYELALEHISDAKATDNNQSIAEARRCLNLLMKSLDMKYDLSQTLFTLYLYADRILARAMVSITRRAAFLDECADILTKLMNSFKAIQKNSDSETVMQNAQQVYAGFTYSGTKLDEYIPDDNKRGYKV